MDLPSAVWPPDFKSLWSPADNVEFDTEEFWEEVNKGLTELKTLIKDKVFPYLEDACFAVERADVPIKYTMIDGVIQEAMVAHKTAQEALKDLVIDVMVGVPRALPERDFRLLLEEFPSLFNMPRFCRWAETAYYQDKTATTHCDQVSAMINKAVAIPFADSAWYRSARSEFFGKFPYLSDCNRLSIQWLRVLSMERKALFERVDDVHLKEWRQHKKMALDIYQKMLAITSRPEIKRMWASEVEKLSAEGWPKVDMPPADPHQVDEVGDKRVRKMHTTIRQRYYQDIMGLLERQQKQGLPMDDWGTAKLPSVKLTEPKLVKLAPLYREESSSDDGASKQGSKKPKEDIKPELKQDQLQLKGRRVTATQLVSHSMARYPEYIKNKESWLKYEQGTDPGIPFEEVMQAAVSLKENRRHVALPYYFNERGHVRGDFGPKVLQARKADGELYFPDIKDAKGFYARKHQYDRWTGKVDPTIINSDGDMRQRKQKIVVQPRGEHGKFEKAKYANEFLSARGYAEIVDLGIKEGHINLPKTTKSMKAQEKHKALLEATVELNKAKEHYREKTKQLGVLPAQLQHIYSRMKLYKRVAKASMAALDRYEKLALVEEDKRPRRQQFEKSGEDYELDIEWESDNEGLVLNEESVPDKGDIDEDMF